MQPKNMLTEETRRAVAVTRTPARRDAQVFPYENKFRFEEIKQKSCHLSRSPMSAKYTLQERIIILVDDTAIKGVWLCTGEFMDAI